MQVTQEQLNPCEVELLIEIEADRVTSAYDETYRELGKRASVPGFRKGKAPREILERFVGEDLVRDGVIERLVQPAYKEALDQTRLSPWAPADLEMVTLEPGEPLVFKAKVPLAPKVELGQYVGLTIEREVPPVTDEHVEREIERIREDRADYPVVTDRPAAEGDTLVIETRADDKPAEEARRSVIDVGQNLPDFDSGVVGMSVDEEKPIEVTYPEDYGIEELRGKTRTIHTRLVEIRKKELPDLTDEWVAQTFVARKEGHEPGPDDVDTVDKLRARVKGAIERAAQETADEGVQAKLLKQIVDSSEVCFPEIMVKERVHHRLERLLEELKQREVTLDDYLRHTERTIEQLYQEYEEDVRRGLKTALVLGEIVRRENIKVEDEDVEAEIRRMAEARSVPVATMRAYLEKTEAMDTVSNRVLHKKAMDFLVHASNIKNAGR